MTAKVVGSNENGLDQISNVMATRNIHVAVVGNVDAGKSTLIGTLITNILDDGRGSSRAAITKHNHELESGRTSTVSTHMLGFKENGDIIVPSPSKAIGGSSTNKKYFAYNEANIVKKANKVVTLMDLAGHEKYLKTTIHGISSGMPDYALILVNSKHPPTHMTRHHMNLVASFGIPIVFVLTKTDSCPKDAMKHTEEEIRNLLRSSTEVDKKMYAIRNEKDIETIRDKLQTLAPIISVSSVTGDGLDLLRKMLHSLPKRRQHSKKASRMFEFLVGDVFNVTGIGPVISGFVNAGTLQIGDAIYIGPMKDGSFIKTIAKSFHVAQTNVSTIMAGHNACIALPLTKQQKKKLQDHKHTNGMVILQEDPTASTIHRFVAEICILKGEGGTITKGVSQTIVHILHVKQSARIVDYHIIDNGLMMMAATGGSAARNSKASSASMTLRSGSRVKVTFEFVSHPEYIRPGMRILFRDGKVRGVGLVKEVFHQQQ